MSETKVKPAHGTICWHEIMTRDATKAAAFYGGLFGWTTESMDMGEAGEYTIFKSGDEQLGGMIQMNHPQFEGVPPHWLMYVAVDDIQVATDNAASLGAEIKVPATPIPNVGHFSVIQDPTGAVFALYQSGG